MILLSDFLKQEYGEKVYKLSLSSGCTCPNRDGTIGFGGCTFCSEGGSGEFASAPGNIEDQIREAKKRIEKKTNARKFIAYFQSFTNTYGDPVKLEMLYRAAIEQEEIVILSLGTRPDCLSDEMIAMLSRLNRIKPVWVELGLQTIHERTARLINRGYELPVFEDAYKRLKAAGLTVIVHVIFSLPGETPEDMLETIRYLAGLHPTLDGIKIQMLQILKNTQMAASFEKEPFPLLTLEEYADLVFQSIQILPPETVIHRMTGDGPRRLLIAPLWSLDKKRVLNRLRNEIRPGSPRA